eukprot:TRINITY_DN8506_c0_g1_i1.p1 TRINITY_DN8506_c0_g1~~TRINITY_DN8506_c0_g1_i1.p1  ORF type:complete len:176 (+),score=10.57 TRINITY_DN8506_c0_g1_i1:74-601(+)
MAYQSATYAYGTQPYSSTPSPQYRSQPLGLLQLPTGSLPIEYGPVFNAHTTEVHPSQRPGFTPKKICYHWARGPCFMGERCTFLHLGEQGSGQLDPASEATLKEKKNKRKRTYFDSNGTKIPSGTAIDSLTSVFDGLTDQTVITVGLLKTILQPLYQHCDEIVQTLQQGKTSEKS